MFQQNRITLDNQVASLVSNTQLRNYANSLAKKMKFRDYGGDDLIQMLCEKLLQKGLPDTVRNVEVYSYMVVKNLAIDLQRKMKPCLDVDKAKALSAPASSFGDFTVKAPSQAFLDAVEDACQVVPRVKESAVYFMGCVDTSTVALKKDNWLVLLLRKVGYELKEIAELLQKSISWVRNHLYPAIESLRRVYDG